MEDLVLTWFDPATKEEFALHCRCTAQGLQVDAQQRLAGKTVSMLVPPQFAEDLAEFFEHAHKRIKGRMNW